MQNSNVCPPEEKLQFFVEKYQFAAQRLASIEAQISAFIASKAAEIEESKAEMKAAEEKAAPIIAALNFPKGKKSMTIMGATVGLRKGKDVWQVANAEKALKVLRAYNCLGYIRTREEVNVAQIGIAPLPAKLAKKAGISLIKGQEKPFIKL